jgi:hypothetical protein
MSSGVVSVIVPVPRKVAAGFGLRYRNFGGCSRSSWNGNCSGRGQASPEILNRRRLRIAMKFAQGLTWLIPDALFA